MDDAMMSVVNCAKAFANQVLPSVFARSLSTLFLFLFSADFICADYEETGACPGTLSSRKSAQKDSQERSLWFALDK